MITLSDAKSKKNAILIEIKGSDLSKVVEQINVTIDQLQYHLTGYDIFARIV